MADTVMVERNVLDHAVRLLRATHKDGFFAKFTAEEAMRHLSIIVLLDQLIKEKH